MNELPNPSVFSRPFPTPQILFTYAIFVLLSQQINEVDNGILQFMPTSRKQHAKNYKPISGTGRQHQPLIVNNIRTTYQLHVIDKKM